MHSRNVEAIRGAILAAFGRQYAIEYPDGKPDSITAKIVRHDDKKRVYYTATLEKPLPAGTVIIADSRRLEITDGEETATVTQLKLVAETTINDYSEYASG